MKRSSLDRRDWRARSAVLLVAWMAGAARLPAAERVAPLCPSVLMVDQDSWARAPEHVNRVALLLAEAPPAARWVQLVPTLHVRTTADRRPVAFGLRINHAASWEAPENFREVLSPADATALRDRCAEQLGAAIQQAVRRGLSIAIVPHLDTAGAVQSWRNDLDFSPQAVLAGASYRSLLLEAILLAIERSTQADTRVDLALSGEMGFSLFSHATEYAAIARAARQRLSQGRPAGALRLGVALNWCDGAGQLRAAERDPPAIEALADAIDFVGFSCYAPVSVPPAAEDFRKAMTRSVREAESLGLTTETMAWQISEVGIGGGARQEAGEAADLLLAKVAARPWEGIGVGAPSPWRDPAYASLRRQYYAALCEYLTSVPFDRGIERAFLWSEGPWDPQGIAPSGQPDAEIARAIAKHNAKVSGNGGEAPDR
ncbi:hypothetical protein [Botrimarina hoheduenensis]|uniref:Uncharacterized protein n=1 Tax=Botrimarina hoheduenensis TaxID=2528000 RepID=A0A5C5VSE6_9BACT|nr:hypothetical protein [Botrimarina hoheduenensis]TWT41538.1 hypothetical protein Pla111_29150 [Botrimarina hoheduenensis]